jgi:hypothetical protein
MGMVLANQTQLDVSRVLQFQATVVELLIGVLFILIPPRSNPPEWVPCWERAWRWSP